MREVGIILGRALVLDRANLDTDQILPPRFLRRPRGRELAQALFHDLRATDPTFPLAAEGNPPILLTGVNFGCGASREAAAHALLDAGIRCVIAPGFADMFGADAAPNGLLAVTLDRACFDRLLHDCSTGAEVVVDLDRQRVSCDSFVYRFEIERFRKHCLLGGRSELELTRESEAADAIDRFEGANPRQRPWATPA